MDEDMRGLLKILADKRIEMSLIRVRENDSDYKNAMAQILSLEEEYASLDLKPEDRKLIDKLLVARDEVNMEQTSLAYLAGMEDCILVLRSLELLQL